MCGIFGLLSPGDIRCTATQARKLIESFYILSESRGKEAAGAALLVGDQIEIVKAPVRGSDFLGLEEARVITDGFVGSFESGRPFALIGHTRMVTNGSDHVHGNNQPVVRDGLVAIHNGIIVNEKALWDGMPGVQRHFEVDTEVVLALCNRRLTTARGLVDALAHTMRDLQGANSIALMSAGHDGIVLATANGSMFVVHHIPTGLTAFASERSILEKIVDIGLRPFLPIAKDAVVQLLPGELTALPLNKPTPVATRWSEAPCHVLATRLSPRTVSDHVTANIRSATIATSVNVSRHAEIETLTIIDWDAIRS